MKRYLQFTAGLLAAGLVLAGCGDTPDKSGEDPSDSKFPNEIALEKGFDPDAHLNWGYVAFASSWDPIKSVTGGDTNFWTPVYDRLLMQETDGSIQPMLAESFEAADDNKSLTLHLRKNVKFSDGTPFDAAAVKFNLDRAHAKDSRISGEVYQIASVDVVDESTVKINVTGGLGSLAVALTARPGMMVSPTAAQSGALEKGPVGVGPYVTTAIDPGVKAEYEKTPDYWDPDAQNVASMTYFYMPEDQTRLNALKSGELDAASINADQFDAVDSAGLNIVTEPSDIFIYFMVNTSVAPFDKPEIRKALNMAIDREAISQGLYNGYCTPQIQPFPESSPGYSKKIGDGLDIFPYDPEAAKKIFEDNGVTSLNITTAAPNVTIYTKFAEVVQAQLADIGITMEIHSLPPTPQVQEFAIDKVTPTFTSVFTGINDPDAIWGRYLAPTALFNPGGATYPELQKYGAEGAASLDPAERTPSYEKYMDAWVDSPPHLIPVCMTYLAAAFSEGISGVRQMPNGATDLRHIAIAKE